MTHKHPRTPSTQAVATPFVLARPGGQGPSPRLPAPLWPPAAPAVTTPGPPPAPRAAAPPPAPRCRPRPTPTPAGSGTGMSSAPRCHTSAPLRHLTHTALLHAACKAPQRPRAPLGLTALAALSSRVASQRPSALHAQRPVAADSATQRTSPQRTPSGTRHGPRALRTRPRTAPPERHAPFSPDGPLKPAGPCGAVRYGGAPTPRRGLGASKGGLATGTSAGRPEMT
jgi:hypothetical protein